MGRQMCMYSCRIGPEEAEGETTEQQETGNEKEIDQ